MRDELNLGVGVVEDLDGMYWAKDGSAVLGAVEIRPNLFEFSSQALLNIPKGHHKTVMGDVQPKQETEDKGQNGDHLSRSLCSPCSSTV